MKVQIISDIHADFHPETISVEHGGEFMMTKHNMQQRANWFFTKVLEPVADTLVIAGDLGEYKYIYTYLVEAAKHWKNIIYVTGNHEYWSCRGYGLVGDEIKRAQAASKNIHWLLDSAVEVNGRRFLGNTLWYPFNDETSTQMWRFRDFSKISCQRRDPWMFISHARTVSYLRQNMEEGDIVVTHHAPCTKSLSDRFPRNDFDCYYASDQTSLMYNLKPAVWIHGHLHDAVDYKMFDTRVVSNPFGYCGYEEISPGAKRFCIEV